MTETEREAVAAMLICVNRMTTYIIARERDGDPWALKAIEGCRAHIEIVGGMLDGEGG